MEEPSRNDSAGSSSTTPTTPSTSSSRSGPSGGGLPLWMGLLLLLALVFMTVAHGGSTGHENVAAGLDNPVAPSTPPPPTPPQMPPPPTTTPPAGGSGSSAGLTGGFKIFESLLGGKGSKASKEGAVNEPASTGSAEGKDEEPSTAAVVAGQGQWGSSDVVPQIVATEEKISLEAAAEAGTATAGEIAAAVDGAPEQPSSPPAAPAPAAQAQPPPPPPPQQQKQAEQQPASPSKPKSPHAEVNYAAEKAGAVVLQSSSSLVGAKNLLDDDKDKYARSPCAESKWVIINLSEDIRIHALVLANYEKFSSMVKDFQVWYSVQCPSLDGEEDSEGWLDLGTFQAREKAGEQRFVVDPPRYARYLKVRLVSHWSREFYCTLSQIKVLGSTLQQGFMDDWQKQKLNIGSQLEAIDPAALDDGSSSSSSSSNQTCLADGTCVAQEKSKQAAEGIEVELPLSSSSSSGSSTDGVDGNVPKAGCEGGGEAPPPGAGNDAGTEQQSEAEPQGEHPPKHDEEETEEKQDKQTTSHTFAEPSVPASDARSVEGEGGRGKTPPSSDEKPAAGAGEAAATEPLVLGRVPNAQGAVGPGEKVVDESVHSPPPPAAEPGKDSSSGEKEKEKEGAATEEPAVGAGEVHKEDGAQTGEKPATAPVAEPPPQGATAQNEASMPPPFLSSPTPVAPASEGTFVEGESGGKKQDIPERNATADLAPAAAGAAAAATTGGTAADSLYPDESAKEIATATPVLNEEGVVTPVPAAEAVPPPPTPPGIAPTPTTTATVVATVSGAPAKTDLMSRFRHQCLQQMRLGDFKKQKLAKLQEDLRAKGGGGAASSLGSGSPYDNIFKTLMDEMTSLEINQSIFDVYVSNLHSCFVQVVDDVLLEQDRARLEAGETIGALQGRLQNQATGNEQLLHRMHSLENSFLVGALAWLIVLAFLVLLACAQVVAWKRLPRTAAGGEEQEQQPEKVKLS